MNRLAALVAALLLAGCSGATARPEGPYVVTAIDYHFHDAHPSAPIRLDRALQFSNQSAHTHNVTIPGTAVDRNFRSGVRITFDPVSSILPEPGSYPFYCKLHRDRGMAGTIVVTDL